MKLFLCISIILSSTTLDAQTWLQMADFPGSERDDGACFVIADTAYCGTGVVPWFAAQRDFYAFDMTAGSWKTIASLPAGEERQYASGFSFGNNGFIVAGYNNGDFLNDIWQYDVVNNTWTGKTALPADGRSGAASFVIDSLAYFIGGKNDSMQALDEVWVYNMLNDAWTKKDPLPFGGRWRSSAAASDSLGYMIFGLDNMINYHPGLYEYRPSSDSWIKISEFPGVERNYSSLNYMNGKLIVFAGMDSLGNFLDDLWSYDIAKGQWTELNPLPSEGRRGGMSFHNGNSIFYTTGIADSSDRLQETWKCVNPTSLKESIFDYVVKLYPNPVQNIFTMVTPTSYTRNTEYLIFDSKGSLLMKEEIKAMKTDIDIGHLPEGLYFVLFRSENEKVLKKLVKR